jgi:hypothetical protein
MQHIRLDGGVTKQKLDLFKIQVQGDIPGALD